MSGRRFALLFGSLLLVIALFEIGLRVAGTGEADQNAWRVHGFHRPDPDLVYSMIPNSESKWATDSFVEEVRTNSLGLRGPEIGQKAPGSRRILILGDSMTFGHGVAEQDTFAARLEQIFRERGADVDVVNAGVKGYGTDHHLKHFETRLRRLDPDIVVLAYYVNDPEDNSRYPLFDIRDDELIEVDATDNPLYRRGRIQQALPGFLRKLRLVQVLGNALAGEASPIGPNSPKEREAWSRKKILLAFERLQKYSEQDGFGFIVLGVPYLGDATDRYRWIRNSDRGGALYRDLSRVPDWRTPRSPRYLESDPHLSPIGHQQIAEELDEFMTLRRKKLRANSG